MHDNFRIAMRMETMPELRQLCHQRLKVVDLTIEDDSDRAIFIKQRLLSAFQINNRETSVTKTHAWLEMRTSLIRPAMKKYAVHSLYYRRIYISLAA
jgi:hypothetical protein